MPRLELLVGGTVQGVGFRPHALRAARALGLTGFVKNSGGRVTLEAQGSASALERLVVELRRIPPPGEVKSVQQRVLGELADEPGFAIVTSDDQALVPALPADLAPCPECLAEVEASGGRRAGYAFTACTRCGARYSIVETLPYDRAGTTLRDFPPCQACAREHDMPADRRCHAQAIACPECGPTLELLDASGQHVARGPCALALAAGRLREGAILALKGVGGFQLLVDALDEAAVVRLRERKRREQKPLAVLLADLAMVAEHATASEAERALLASPEAPIVLLTRKPGQAASIAPAVAPDNPQLGCLLPASPLHHLLLRAVARPLVCTSGNSSGEPLCVETDEALQRLGGIADAFLVHDRAIARPLDDSVARVGPRGTALLRRARGYAPRVVAELGDGPTVLALGAELKAAPSLLLHGALVLGQHVGDLGELRTLAAFQRNTADLLGFFQARPDIVACDLHPDYASTHHAEALAASFGVPLRRVQHHHAHIAAATAEHGLSGPVLGIAWDGTGLGTDQTIWGGEVLLVDGAHLQRVACLPQFRLPGGDKAAREPWRSALGLLFSVDPQLARAHAANWLEPQQLETLLGALGRGVSSPVTSSVGRLFDAIAALAGHPERIDYEGQAAMRLEFAAHGASASAPYPLELLPPPDGAAAPAAGGLQPLVECVLKDVAARVPVAEISSRFHAGLIAAAVRAAARAGVERVVLSGGCFQNRLLCSGLLQALEAAGHRVFLPGQVPCNDGGISAGQAHVASLLTG